ncbi:leader peptidase (prepilin peptidase)/N-methyltransferase [Modestobacter roseus]|uniref:Leader peptidase (Prepilin peptidase)/N-methyltransferase n=2 Tax=Modestobacter roseus TaxID=1181884 RepID=A0A562INA1_9ACTN|nr:prepilin peptidase [Modestobacter roseus]TWH72497.1 leader peptidase (prepilin peptidase)/N-methyltransferase [Modestobacter roseus]
MIAALAAAGALLGGLLGPRLAAATVRLARRDPTARPAPRRVVATCLVAAAAIAAAPVLAGLRPAAVALAWFGGAAVVLAGVDLASHRLPDRVTAPAALGVAAALTVDAAVTGTWPAVGRALLAAAVAWAVLTGVRLVDPRSFGGGDVKLLGLLGLLLGWAGWDVLLTGVFAGLLIGALGSLLLIATGRAQWRTAIAFGPPLLLGAYVALALAGPLPGA